MNGQFGGLDAFTGSRLTERIVLSAAPPVSTVDAAHSGRNQHGKTTLNIPAPRTAASVRAKAALALAGMAWLLPFLSPNFREPISSFYGEAVAIVLGLAAITMLAGRTTWAGLQLPRSSLVFLGFAVLILLHAVTGRNVYFQANLLGILYLFWATGMAALGWRLKEIFGVEKLVAVLSWFLLVGALASAALGLLQLLGTPSWMKPLVLLQVNGRIYANTGQPNHLADYLCLGLVSLGYLHARASVRLPLAVVAAAPLLIVLAASGSRSVWLYLPFVFLLSAAFWKLRPSPEARRVFLFAAIVIAEFLLAQSIAGALSTASVAPVDLVASRVRSEGLLSPIRTRLWQESWLMFLDAPLLGQGFRQFAWQHFLLNARLPQVAMGDIQYDNAHNLLLHVLAEFGLVGIAVLVAGAAAWIAGVARQPVAPPLWWMLGVAAILGIHSMLEYPLWYSYFLGIAAVLIGASDTVAIRPGGRTGGRLVPVLVLALGWMAAVNIYQDYRTLQSLHRVQTRERAADGRGTAEILLDLQQYSLFTPFVELALSRMISLESVQLDDKLVVNEAVMRFSPVPDVVYRQAALLALAGRREEARVLWDRATANYPESRTRMMQTLEAASGREPAIGELLDYARSSKK